MAEIVILFAGVVARYVLHRPLVWSDELASILFLWLAMLGAAVAFRRDEHMRMTAIVASASPAGAAFLDVVATGAALAFLLLIAWPAFEYAHEESLITTPALEITNAWRAAALPVGIGLMALFALLRLLRVGIASDRGDGPRDRSWRIVGLFWLAEPAVPSARQPQPGDLLRRRRGGVASSPACRSPSRSGLRSSAIWPDDANAAHGARRPHGRGHVATSSCCPCRCSSSSGF